MSDDLGPMGNAEMRYRIELNEKRRYGHIGPLTQSVRRAEEQL